MLTTATKETFPQEGHYENTKKGSELLAVQMCNQAL
jgi:hypothetical protein